MPEKTLQHISPGTSADGNEALSAHSGLTAGSRFLRACLRQPVDQTPVWFLRQAGRYMPEYQAVRRHHSLLQICKNPELAAEVTITAAEKLDVDAAIIFADLLLPLECMGLDFEFLAGEGPVIHHPVRTAGDVENLRIDRAHELGYVAEAIRKVVAHFKDRIGIIGFCGAPFTLASYMIEGGGSSNYIHTKSLMYREPSAWRLLLDKLASVLAEFAAQQVEAGADVIQIFDSWAGALSPTDYRDFVLPVTTRLVRQVQALGVPVIYFGVDTATLLPAMRETGADVIGLDWRVPLDQGWPLSATRSRCKATSTPSCSSPAKICCANACARSSTLAGGRPGHIFNLGHGIVPGTPVENVQRVVRYVREFSAISGGQFPCLRSHRSVTPFCCLPTERPSRSIRFPNTCAMSPAGGPCPNQSLKRSVTVTVSSARAR